MRRMFSRALAVPALPQRELGLLYVAGGTRAGCASSSLTGAFSIQYRLQQNTRTGGFCINTLSLIHI